MTALDGLKKQIWEREKMKGKKSRFSLIGPIGRGRLFQGRDIAHILPLPRLGVFRKRLKSQKV